MTDARFPERWLNDARLQRVHSSAYRLYGNALMWAVSNRTEGHVPPWALAGLIPHGSEAGAEELTDVGLWASTADGWQIVDFQDTQSSRDELDALAARRRSDKQRKAAQRKREAQDLSRDPSRDGHAERVRTGQARTGQARQGQAVREAELAATWRRDPPRRWSDQT